MVSPIWAWDGLPLAVVLSSFVPGVLIMFLREEQTLLRNTLNMTGALAKVAFVGLMLQGVAAGASYEWAVEILPGLELSLAGDALALLFVTLSAVLWLVTTVYAIGYMEASRSRTRFFAFFSLCVTATTGIAMAGDLFTFVIFYEALTWATYPLVVHNGTPEAIRAGRTYLAYTLGAGAILVVGAVGFEVTAGTVAFAAGGVVDPMAVEAEPIRYFLLFLCLLIGMGVKSAIFPIHGWLPTAMVAPAPVSALLHAVAVVKAGAFGIIRLIHSLFGIEVSWEMGLTTLVAVLASFTIVYASVRALAQTDIKRILAFSTVSQLSYIALGVALLDPLAQVGGLVHLVHQGIMKITLFFCAGIIAQTLGVKTVGAMGGVARRMPLTMAAFTVGALGMIGLPPVAGFISKWYLGLGALGAGAPWVILVLLASSLLNAAYFLPILRTAYFDEPSESWSDPWPHHRLEADWRMVFPAVITAALSLAVGVFAASDWSPLGWALLIVERGAL